MDSDSFIEVMSAVLVELRAIRAILEKNVNPPSTTNDAKQTYIENRNDKSQAIAFCMEHDWLFIRSANGQYPHLIANKAASDFLSKHGPIERRQFSEALNQRRSSLEGVVRVYAGVFEDLYRDFVVNGR